MTVHMGSAIQWDKQDTAEAQNVCSCLCCKAALPQILGHLSNCQHLCSPTRGREAETYTPSFPTYSTAKPRGLESVQTADSHGKGTLQKSDSLQACPKALMQRKEAAFVFNTEAISTEQTA